MTRAARRICSRCVLPESTPDIEIDAGGICSVCLEHERRDESGNDAPALESDFIKILKKHKGKGEYDCLVMCSGGKDSISALYYLKRRYGATPLAFTFDHGFETDEALDNVRNAVDRLGVDYLFFKTDFMNEMFEHLLKSGSKAVICHPCSIWYMDLTYKMAARFGIPIIIAGWTKGQSTRQETMSKCGCNINQPEFQSMARETLSFLDGFVKSHPKYEDFPRSMEEVLVRSKKRKHKAVVLSPHWFMPHDADTYVKVIQEELGWKYPQLSYPGRSTNCALNFISVYNSMKHYGYTHYHVEMSKMIRAGLMTREEALRDLEIDFDTDLLNRIAEPLGYVFP